MTDRPHPTGVSMPYTDMHLSDGTSTKAVPLSAAMKVFDSLDWQDVMQRVRIVTVDGVEWVALQDVIDEEQEIKR